MDHEPRRQVAGCGNHRLSSVAAALPGHNLLAGLQYRRAAGTVNGAIHPTTAQQRAVGRIYNGIGFCFGDITLNNVEAGCLCHEQR
jgi:hypothetical protein